MQYNERVIPGHNNLVNRDDVNEFSVEFGRSEMLTCYKSKNFKHIEMLQ